ncbi:MAG: NUDIX hydrolase [Candidatus Tectimicrobiota bacterium]
MPLSLAKYWYDLLLPVLRQERPPVIPQAVILQEQQVLLVQRDSPRFWELPGGSSLPGEAPETAVVREVREETGVQVRVIELLGWYERTGFRAHRAPVYLCQPEYGQPLPGDSDVRQVRYFPVQRLPWGLCPWYRSILARDLWSVQPRPLQQTQRLGWRTVLHCVGLDLASRLGVLR